MAGAASNDIHKRVTLIEETLHRFEREMAQKRQDTANSISTLSGEIVEVKDELLEKIDDVVRAQAVAEKHTNDKIDKVVTSQAAAERGTNEKIDQTNKRLDGTNERMDTMIEKISILSTKSSIHAWIFGVLGSVALVMFASYTKSTFDLMYKSQQTINTIQNRQDRQEGRQDTQERRQDTQERRP